MEVRKVRHCLGAWVRDPLVRGSLVLFLSIRVGLSLWGALVLALIPVDLSAGSPARPYLGSEPVDSGLARYLLEPWQRFDVTHYLHIAREGYRLDQDVYSIRPPLYPLLIRWLGGWLGGEGQYLLAALLIANAAALGYCLVFAALARDAVGSRYAGRAQLYAMTYPWAFFLLVGYAESLFLFLTALAFWAMWRRRWWMAGVCGGLAALTRVQGAVLALPLLFEALHRRRFRPLPLRSSLVWSVLPGLAAVGFLVWRALAGFEPVHAVLAAHFHIDAAWPWESLSYAVRVLVSGGAHVTDYLDLGAALLFLALTALAWRRLSPAYALYMAAAWWFSVSHMRVPHPLASTGRYMLALFPAFFLLGRAGTRHPWLHRLILYPSLALLLFLSANFALWGWSG
jgi:hypothetical protein